MLLVTIEALFAVSEHCEVTADTRTGTYTNVWEWTIDAIAATIISKMHTERRAFWRRLMREIACISGIGAIPLEEVPADSNL